LEKLLAAAKSKRSWKVLHLNQDEGARLLEFVESLAQPLQGPTKEMVRKSTTITKFPVIMYGLDPSCVGYDKGARFRLNTIEDDEYYFPTRKDADEFILRHGLKHINES
jgi:hypothetical protein